MLEELEGDATGGAFDVGRGFKRHDLFERRIDVVTQPKRQPILHALEIDTGQRFVSEDDDARTIEAVAFGEFGHDVTAPAQATIGC
jgi:hypothetical protein